MVDSEGHIGKRKLNGKEGNQKRTWFPKIIGMDVLDTKFPIKGIEGSSDRTLRMAEYDSYFLKIIIFPF